MNATIRGLAIAFAVIMWGMYLYTALSAGSLFGWVNGWMGGAIAGICIVTAAFVLTVRRAGTGGSVISDLSRALRRVRFTDPVEGTATVVSASGQPRGGQNAGSAMCEMHLVVTIPGQPSVAVNTANIVPLAKWPTPGVQLPVLAERSDPRTFKIRWDRVGTGWDLGRQQAQALADQLNAAAGQAGGAPTGGGGIAPGWPVVMRTSQILNSTGQPASATEIARFERLTGMDINGDGVIGEAGGAPGEEQRPADTGGTTP